MSRQPPQGSESLATQIEQVQSLRFLLGRWHGRGWTMTSSGGAEFEQQERVRSLLSGELITVEGRATGPGADVEKFSAFALVSYDVDRSSLRWRAYSSGHCVDVEVQVNRHSFCWALEPTPGVQLRFQAEVAGDTWHETGRVSTDGGASWSTTLEMELHRSSEPA